MSDKMPAERVPAYNETMRRYRLGRRWTSIPGHSVRYLRSRPDDVIADVVAPGQVYRACYINFSFSCSCDEQPCAHIYALDHAARDAQLVTR